MNPNESTAAPAVNMLGLALYYIGLGLSPLPIGFREKKPTINDWPNLRITQANAAQYFFNGTQQNIGIILGEASKGLVDVDIDCDEALKAAPLLLPKTSGRFGRASKRASHWLYFADIPKALKFEDPIMKDGPGKTIIELRANGGQTIFPGSTHKETGELIELETGADLATIPQMERSLLEKEVGKIAAASALARYFPSKGNRHNFMLALAGALLRDGWSIENAGDFVTVVAFVGGLDPARLQNEPAAAVKSTAEKLEEGEPVTGWRQVAEALTKDGIKSGKKLVTRVRKWLPSAATNNKTGGTSSDLPRVCDGTDVHRIIDEFERHLFDPEKGDDRLYRRASELVVIRGAATEDAKRLKLEFTPGEVLIAGLKPSSILPRITKHIDFGQYLIVEDEPKWIPTTPLKEIREAFLSKADAWPSARLIRGISTNPIVHLDDGTIVNNGYDPKTKYFVASNLELPDIPERPTLSESQAALAELVEPFEEFQVETAAARYMPVALVLTIILRAVLRGNVPTFIQVAPQKNCGKSLQTKAAILLATGRIPASNTWPKLEEEQEKVLSSAAEAGVDVLFFDNVPEGSIIGGAPLDKVLTCDGETGFRILGRTQLKRMPWPTTVVYTANRAGVGGDTDRRAVMSHVIRSPIEEYKHPNLLDYIRDNRARFVAAAFTLVRGWIADGSQRVGVRRLDSFEHWAWSVCSMIRWAGGGDVRELVLDAVGTEKDQHELALLKGIHEYLSMAKKADVTTKELVEDVYEKPHLFAETPAPVPLAPVPGAPAAARLAWYDALYEAIDAIGGTESKDWPVLNRKRFGKRLAGMKDVTHSGYRLRQTGNTHGKPRWTVVRGPFGPSGCVFQSHASGENGSDSGSDSQVTPGKKTDPNGPNGPRPRPEGAPN